VAGTDTPSAQADTIIGISFDDQFRAQEFMSAISRLHSHNSIRLVDAVVVTKGADGRTRVKETVDLQPGRAALSGAVWTGLLGLIIGGPVGWVAGLGMGAGAGMIAAKVVDVGVPDEWVQWFRDAVEPDTFTVVVLADAVNTDELVEETRRFEGAHLVYANMDVYAIRRLEIALGEASIDDEMMQEIALEESLPEEVRATGQVEHWPPPKL
jgi:uncharacterized membrane protein